MCPGLPQVEQMFGGFVGGALSDGLGRGFDVCQVKGLVVFRIATPTLGGVMMVRLGDHNITYLFPAKLWYSAESPAEVIT